MAVWRKDRGCENPDLTWCGRWFYKSVDREYPEIVESPRPVAELLPTEAQNQPPRPPATQVLCPGAKTKAGRWGAQSPSATPKAREGHLHGAPIPWDQSPFCQLKTRPIRRTRQL